MSCYRYMPSSSEYKGLNKQKREKGYYDPDRNPKRNVQAVVGQMSRARGVCTRVWVSRMECILVWVCKCPDGPIVRRLPERYCLEGLAIWHGVNFAQGVGKETELEALASLVLTCNGSLRSSLGVSILPSPPE